MSIESFATSNQEILLSQTSGGTLWTTALTNANVMSSVEMTIDTKTVKNSNLSGLGAFIAIWRGTSAPTSTSDFIGVTNLSGTSDGNFNKHTIKVTASDVSLITDTVTIGLFLRGNDISSLSASISLLNGQQFNPQQSSVYALSISNRTILANYLVPQFVQPSQRLDWIYLLKGDQPIMNSSGSLTHASVPTNATSGVVNIDVSGIRLEPGRYILQYNPGHSTQTVSAAYSFSIE